MNEKLKELFKKAFNVGAMYEATLSNAYSFDSFIKDNIEQLRLYDVVGRSEQLPCGDLIRHNFSLSKIGRCITCDRSKDKAR